MHRTYLPRSTFLSGLAGAVALALVVPATSVLHADDEKIAERLRGLGAEVTVTSGSVSAVAIKDAARLTADDYAALAELKSLKMLSLSGDTVTDATLEQLQKLTALEDLSTNLAQFSDEGLKQLTALTHLKQIKFFHTSLRNGKFNGSGLAHLIELKNLRRLTVAGCPFDDNGMAAVGRLTQLENFRTWHTYQTEAGNVHLKSLTNLKSLHLGQRLRRYDGTSNAHSLSDATIGVLAELRSLEALILDEAQLSAAALAQLAGLTNLKQLSLQRIDRSEADVASLRQALPRVQIEWKPLTNEERTALARFLKP